MENHNEDIDKSKVNPKRKFPIVGIGSSAGGLEALEKLFSNMPSDTGMGFVLIQHLDPSHESTLADLIARYTDMEVFVIKDEMPVQPNKIYVIPPNREVGIKNGVLTLFKPLEPHGFRRPIDLFFQALADDQEDNAICIILSGFGSDGTRGLAAIKSAGGMVIAQDPTSASSEAMPDSAIATDLVDYVATPEKMHEYLISYVQRLDKRPSIKVIGQDKETNDLRQRILVLVKKHTGHNFSLYKKSTINRRIGRRMTVLQLDKLSDYLEYIQQNPHEANVLFKEFLINVTSFFRDTEAFESFKSNIISEVLDKKTDGENIRLWIPGCSTGEEIYSIAIIIHEYMENAEKFFDVQLFGTDIDKDAIEMARTGVYPSTISSELTKERLNKFFSKKDDSYMINKNLREMVIFAPHDLLKDPPFINLDIISCRNVLIYMNKDAQKKLLSSFNYGLKTGGILFLGPSESIGSLFDSFKTLDNKWKIYQNTSKPRLMKNLMNYHHSELHYGSSNIDIIENDDKSNPKMEQIIEKIIIENYAPSSVVIDNQGKIIFIYGRVGKYLEPAQGSASLNILDMVREGIKFELNSAINNAVSKGDEIEYKNLEVKTNGDFQLINLKVKPINKPESMKGLLMVIFEDIESPEHADGLKNLPKTIPKKNERIIELEYELKLTKKRLQATIEQLETSNEELKSANEELQSMNEELQSTNEELETSKEELQSLNEELLTVNSELQSKVEEMAEINDDMNNLLNSTEIATIFVDKDIKIKRFTQASTKLINLIPYDAGRPLKDIVSNLKYDRLIDDVKSAINRVIYTEKEVRTKEGKWYIIRIVPYKTHEDIIDGAVITFVDIDQQKRAQIVTQHSLDYVEGIVETVREPLIVLDDKIKVISANKAFYDKFKVSPEITKGKLLYTLGNNQWDISELKELMEKIISNDHIFENFLVEHEFPQIGHKKMLLNARKIHQKGTEKEMILLAIEEVT
ncbi:CheR family methyltransferase [Methanobacterium sp. ACI-7]|uniref:CheR family methyltransferase n=1 Tax=unclassified Methanobacterium TaxID=2627676 RepID=UPI0039C4BF6A